MDAISRLNEGHFIAVRRLTSSDTPVLIYYLNVIILLFLAIGFILLFLKKPLHLKKYLKVV